MSAQFLEPGGRASRTGARLNKLIKRHYVQMLRTYQERGRLRPDVDPVALSDLIVGITTMDFGRFISGSGGTIEDLLKMGVPHLRLILTGAPGRSARPQDAKGGLNGVDSKFLLRDRARAPTLRSSVPLRCKNPADLERVLGAITENEWRYNQLIKQFPSEAEPPFEDAGLLERWWGRNWGCTTDVGRLRVVLMHRPGEEVNIVDTSKRLDSNAFGDEQTGWYWRGTEGPDLAAMQAQHDAYTAVLRSEGVEVVYLDEAGPGRMKSCYTRDSRDRGRRRRHRHAARPPHPPRRGAAGDPHARPPRLSRSCAPSPARASPKAAASPGSTRRPP